MSLDPAILCFKHCNDSIFMFNVPDSCPCCGKSLIEAPLYTEPFRIPYPFVQAKQTRCNILLKPTDGDFLNNYRLHSDLHIGATTSNGVIVEYDSSGLRNHIDANNWTQCLSVEQLNDTSWYEHWDNALQNVADNFTFSSDKYEEDNFNCYTFILTFVRSLRCNISATNVAISKESFCKELVTPRLTVAYKYISLYREILHNGFYIEHGA